MFNMIDHGVAMMSRDCAEPVDKLYEPDNKAQPTSHDIVMDQQKQSTSPKRRAQLEELEKRLQETQALQQLSQDLVGALEINQILDTFFMTCTIVLGFEYVQHPDQFNITTAIVFKVLSGKIF
jgi:hypothetical protein